MKAAAKLGAQVGLVAIILMALFAVIGGMVFPNNVAAIVLTASLPVVATILYAKGFWDGGMEVGKALLDEAENAQSNQDPYQ